ncbi:preprotein translocase subunit YajC [Pseudonocardia spinosispora]|uniref:preprotein translocase subunit YajC n=1 Tax=Pseudonocardia spinosispora TaxID=103441 RepID=UPI0004021660|nr:preprotein translocase subunit YajC [Pseudonocardia spinosispora]
MEYLFPLLIILLFIPIFLSGRKQKAAAAQMAELQKAITEGDVVMTTSGLRGTVVDASYEDTIDIEIAPGVVTTWIRQAVREKVNPQAEHTDEGPEQERIEAPVSETPSATATPEVTPSGDAKTETKADSEPESSANGTTGGRGNA